MRLESLSSKSAARGLFLSGSRRIPLSSFCFADSCFIFLYAYVAAFLTSLNVHPYTNLPRTYAASLSSTMMMSKVLTLAGFAARLGLRTGVGYEGPLQF